MSYRTEDPDGRGRRTPSWHLNHRLREMPFSEAGESHGRGRRSPAWQESGTRELPFPLLEMPFSGLPFSGFGSGR
jgi:hypothetical protein